MSSPSSVTALAATLRQDQRRRWRGGERPLAEEYLARYPELLGDAEAAIDLIFNEVLLREELGEPPGADEYRRRFPEHAEVLAAQIGLHRAVAGEATIEGLPVAPSHSTSRHWPSVAGYDVLAELGRGGMGVVYKARHLALNRLVALKCVLAGSAADALQLVRVRQEAELAARLHHPNIVQIHEVGLHDGSPYLALEFVDGPTLAQLLGGRPRPPREAAGLVETLARAVGAAHDKGIVHRDLKPANVLMATAPMGADQPGDQLESSARASALHDYTPKVADFGLAKRLDADARHTVSGAILGTPAYMAPEQARGAKQAVGVAADVYALGAILYECLTGRPPFQAATVLETLEQVCSQDPVPPSQLQPRLPRDLSTACLKCLEKEPSRRYASAQALADDLRRFLEGLPVVARPLGVPARLGRWCRRNPMVASLLLAVAVSLLAGAGVATYFAVEADARARDAEREAGRADAKAGEARENLTKAIRAADNAQRSLYLARVNLADAAWREGKSSQVEFFLRQISGEGGQPSFRGWDFHQLQRSVRTDVGLFEHGGEVKRVAFSRDGRWLASAASIDNEGIRFRVWDMVSRRQTLVGSGGATGLAFGPAGELAVADGDQVRVVDVRTGKEVRTLKGIKTYVKDIAISPDGKQLVAVSGTSDDHDSGELVLWDYPTGQLRHRWAAHTEDISSVAFNADGRLIASGSKYGAVRLWDATTAKLVRSMAGEDEVTSVAFSPDGRLAVACGGLNDPSDVKIFDREGRLLKRLTGHIRIVWGVAFSPDGKHLVSAGFDETVRLWDSETGQELQAVRGHGDRVSSVAYSPDGRLIASGGDDGTVRLWAVGGDEPRIVANEDEVSYHLAFSPDSQRLAANSDLGVVVREVVTGREVYRLPGQFNARYSPDGRWLATVGADRVVSLRDARTGRKLRDVTTLLPQFLGRRGRAELAYFLAFSEDGAVLLVSGMDGLVRRYELASGKEQPSIQLGEKGESSIGLLSDDGRYLVRASDTSVVTEIWSTGSGRRLARLESPLYFLAFSHASRLRADLRRDTIEVIETASGQRLHTMVSHAKFNEVTSLSTAGRASFSRDESRLATYDDEGALRIWDLTNGQQVRTLRGHTNSISASAFSPDGNWLASSDWSGQVKLWDGRPFSAEAQAEREAVCLLERLYTDPRARPDARAALRKNATLPDAVRRKAEELWPTYAAAQDGREAIHHVKAIAARPLPRSDILSTLREKPHPNPTVQDMALAFAEHRPDSADEFNNAAWPLVAKPGQPKAHAEGLRLAQIAYQLAPKNGVFLNTLGLAYYRAGKWEQALDALKRAEKINAPTYRGRHPADLAFLAMASHQLKQHKEARAYLDRLREVMKESRWAKDEESVAFLREAEGAIESTPRDQGQHRRDNQDRR